MRRLLFAIISSALSVSVFAGLPLPPANSSCGWIPKLCPGFVVGVTGYYIQPFTNQNDDAYASSNRDYDWGWSINAGYLICNTPYDLNINYFYFDTKDKNTVHQDGINALSLGNNQFTFPFNLPANFDAIYNNKVNASVVYNINQLDLSAGEIVNITHCSYVHPFVGLRLAQLKRNLNTYYFQSSTFFSETNITQIQNVNFDEKSRFQGIGPLVGFDIGYGLSYGFGIAGHFKGAILLGKTNFSTNEIVSQQLDVGPVQNFVSDAVNLYADSINRVVPASDIKLGINWRCFNKQNSDSNLMIEAGWQTTHYYHQAERLQTNTIIQNGFVEPLIADTQVTGRFTTSDGFNGPYISLILRS